MQFASKSGGLHAATLVLVVVSAMTLISGCAGPASENQVQAGPKAATTPLAESHPNESSKLSSAPTRLPEKTESMADLIVEIHVPLTPSPGLGKNAYPYPWIDDIEEYLAELDGSDGEEYDSGEELGSEYLFFVAGAPEARLIKLARKVSKLKSVPAGVYATVNDSDGDMGQGRRVDL